MSKKKSAPAPTLTAEDRKAIQTTVSQFKSEWYDKLERYAADLAVTTLWPLCAKYDLIFMPSGKSYKFYPRKVGPPKGPEGVREDHSISCREQAVELGYTDLGDFFRILEAKAYENLELGEFFKPVL